MNYQVQAEKFAKDNNVKLKVIDYNYTSHSFDEKGVKRWVFKLRLSRNRKTYTFKFGQSINNGAEQPTMYDVLTCLTKYEVGTFEDFCNEFGYNNDSIKAHKTYIAVDKEYKNVLRLFSDIMEELSEIQ